MIMERRDYVPGEETTLSKDDDDDYAGSSFAKFDTLKKGDFGGSAYSKRYTAKLLDSYEDNSSVDFDCHIYNRFEYIYEDIPREGITFINKPHSTDLWLEAAFRKPITLPEDMVPNQWRDLGNTSGGRKIRGSSSTGTRGGSKAQTGTRAGGTKKKEMTEEEKEDEEDYQDSLIRWTDTESRRERLNDLKEKKEVIL